MPEIKSYEETALLLGASKPAWEKLVGYIRFRYAMDELWTTGKTTGKLSAYHNELKFRRGGKTLATLYVRDGFFKAVIILGKGERAIFEERQSEFSDTIRKLYNDTHTYHDGKWLGINVSDMTLIDDIIRLLNIKRKPNRKIASVSEADKQSCNLGKCDLGLTADEVAQYINKE